MEQTFWQMQFIGRDLSNSTIRSLDLQRPGEDQLRRS